MLLIFTDIDGTLIDHHDYNHQIAQESLGYLTNYKIPVIFCSSKTFDEQVKLQTELNIKCPFIIENGSAVVFPKNYFSYIVDNQIVVNNDYAIFVLSEKKKEDITTLIEDIWVKFKTKIIGFSDADDVQIYAKSGLQGEAIKRAKNKLFTETIISPKHIDSKIISFMEDKGFQISQGGRFLTIQDKSINKGKAVEKVMEMFKQENFADFQSIGIGDSYNDLSMLEVVDKPFLVQKYDGDWADIKIKNLEKIPAVGPIGFNLIIEKIIATLS